MTSYLSYNYKKPSSLYPGSSSESKKKIKHFSYSPADKIGKGFSSIVYKGSNDLTNETVAIKAIDMKGVKDQISRQMLDCQIEALTTLNHGNILKCYDVVRQVTHCYIITEFCNQGDLSDLVKKKRRISQNQALKLLKDIVSGFVQMGEKRFLHRDLKLANIFMHEGNAIIADFGFAKKHTNIPQRQKYNVGSPLYMSPEALKKNIYSIKNDIWSIGIMAFQMLHGETPWECRTEKELIDKMTRIPVKFRDSLNISSPTKDFIRKCLEVDERKRMALQDMKMWLQGQGQRQDAPLRRALGNIENLPTSNNDNKLSSREQKSHSFSTSNQRPSLIQNKENQYPVNHRQSYKSKENRPFNSKEANKQNNGLKGVSLVSLPKATIEANNNILVIEINTFRLLYKILEKVRKYEPQAKELVGYLAGEVLKRIHRMKSFCCDEEENSSNKIKVGLQYGIKEHESYLSELKNPSIKKYKSVIREYHKKYTSELQGYEPSNYNSTYSISQIIRSHLKQKSYFSTRQLSNQQLVYMYWMIEFVDLKKDVKKEYLDEVIQPKHLKLSKQYLQDRVSDL